MAVFFILLGAALVATISYAAYADHTAKKNGQILVPVKRSRFGRTDFVRMDRAELAEQKAAAAYAEQERQRTERKNQADEVQVATIFGGIFGGANRRLRRR